MTRIAVKRPVTTFMIILIFVSFGLMSLLNLRMDLLPNMNIPIAIVYTTYVGASPEQIQKLVTEPVEGAMARLDGLDTLSSTSSENVSIVILQFEQNVDIDMAAIDIREAVDMVKGRLPDDASAPIVMKMDINNMASIMIAVASETDDLVSLKSKVDNDIVDRITRQEGVASVDVSGGREKEIRVDLIEDRIRGYGITESQVAQTLGVENSSMPVGTVKEAAKNLTIKVDGEFTSADQILDIPIATATGSIVYIRDIAQVTDAYKEISSYAYLNGLPGVVLSISKQSTANTVNVSKAVMRELASIIRDYPELELEVIMDPADYITSSINSVASSAVSGIALAVIVLFIFLRNVRTTLVVGSAIPLSILVTFAFMYFAGMTLNLMSLGGLTLGVGMLVDNSIVVLESIFRRMEEGESKSRAAINGAKEVAMSIVSSTLTTVAVFLPVAWMGGMIAQVFNDLALSISFALTASLLVALTFVPLTCSLFLSPSTPSKSELFIAKGTRAVLNLLGKGLDKLDKSYRVALRWATGHRWIVMLLSVVIFVSSLLTAASVGMELMPSSDQSEVDITINLPTGALLERTKDITDQVTEQLQNIPEIRDVAVVMGSGGIMMGGSSDLAQVMVTLVPMKERDRSSTEVADEIRRRMQNIAGARFTVEAVTSMMGTGTGTGGDVQYNVKGDDIGTLTDVSNDLIALLETVPGLRDVSSTISDTAPQATIKVDRMKASAFGLSAGSVMQVVNTNVSGTTATTLKVGGDEIDIRVGQDSGKVQSLEDVENLLIPTPMGVAVPLREIATVSITESPMSISRENQQTQMTVYGSLDNRDLGSVTREIDALIASRYVFPQGVTLQKTGNSQTMNEEILNMIFAFLVGILVVYAIMAAEFESMYYPLIIMGVVPTALSTGFFGLFVMQHTFGITAALGMIMLLGIVVNNGIVLIDYINLLRGKGMDLMEAIQEAGPVRLRAILMTTLTTTLGLMPMMLGAQEGSEMMQPLATVVVWGLTCSTLITLFLVPCIYLIFERIRIRLFGKRQKFRKIEEI